MSHSELQQEMQREERHSCTELEAEECVTLIRMLSHLTGSIRELPAASDSPGTLQTFLRCFIQALQEKNVGLEI